MFDKFRAEIVSLYLGFLSKIKLEEYQAIGYNS